MNQTPDNFDVAVVGGGIVGTATAMALSKTEGLTVVLIEAEEALAVHQTGHNSGVIHSGLYYKPGSLKAENCVKGRQQLEAFCEERGIPYDRCGKIVVATKQEEIPALEELERRGRDNGLVGMRRLSALEISEYEPTIEGIAGLHVPQTGIVDFARVTKEYGKVVEENGGRIFFNSALKSVVQSLDSLMLKTKSGVINAGLVINCAGLQSDRVARMCGVDPQLKIVPFKGEYYEVIPERRGIVKNLVYPVPDPRFPFLGVHFTRMINGTVEAGPNAVLALKRDGYGRFSFSLKDIFSYLFYGGFWKMVRKYGKTGLGELWRSLSKRAFVSALQRIMPSLQLSDVHRGCAGIRAQALEPSGALSDDFRILDTDRMIHVLNAPSPAATASMAIGQYIAELAKKKIRSQNSK